MFSCAFVTSKNDAPDQKKNPRKANFTTGNGKGINCLFLVSLQGLVGWKDKLVKGYVRLMKDAFKWSKQTNHKTPLVAYLNPLSGHLSSSTLNAFIMCYMSVSDSSREQKNNSPKL